MPHYRNHLGWVVLLSLTSCPPAWGGPTTVREVGSRLRERDRRLEALAVEYRSDVSPSLDYPEGAYLHRFVAAKRPGFLRHDSAHGDARIDWRDDPVRQFACVSPDRAISLRPLERIIFDRPLPPSKPLPGTLPQEFLFHALCWWPFEGRPAPSIRGRPWSLSSLLDGDTYRLRPAREAVRGRLCDVLEWPGFDVLWVDSGPECNILRREVYEPESGALAERLEFEDFHECRDGIWLPGRIHNIQFDVPAHAPELRRRKVVDSLIVLLDVAVNGDVDDVLFRPPCEPGSIRHEPGGADRLVADGEIDHARDVAAWGRRILARTPATGWPSAWQVVMALALGSSIGRITSTAVRARGRVATGGRPLDRGGASGPTPADDRGARRDVGLPRPSDIS